MKKNGIMDYVNNPLHGIDAGFCAAEPERAAQILAAMWAADTDRLHELAPCGCCCHEHTGVYCEARLWGGCRSGLAYGETDPWDEPGWREHYRKHHGMSNTEFYGTHEGGNDGT